jgi:hypothetical protein
VTSRLGTGKSLTFPARESLVSDIPTVYSGGAVQVDGPGAKHPVPAAGGERQHHWGGATQPGGLTHLFRRR